MAIPKSPVPLDNHDFTHVLLRKESINEKTDVHGVGPGWDAGSLLAGRTFNPASAIVNPGSQLYPNPIFNTQLGSHPVVIADRVYPNAA
jgi:hypothetical protein